MADVFLCHNSSDTEDVTELAKRLQAEGISVWLDKFNLIPGQRFTGKIEEALDACSATAVFVGKTGRSPYQNEEFEYALNTRGRRDERIIPVLLPGAGPEMITGFLASRTRVQFKASLDESEAFYLLICGIRGVPPDLGGAASAGESPKVQHPDQCPYRPLAVFDLDDHEYFCGRDQLTADTVARVEAVLDRSTRFFFIVGASGSGKSSLARAGVIWSLKERHPDWKRLIMEPGPRPHETLAERVLKLNRASVDGLTLKTHADAYLSDTDMLRRSVTGEIGNDLSKGRLLLFVDQFEEVFTVCESKAAADAFIGNLLCAAADPAGKTVVLACVRADFYENCARTEMAGVLSTQQILVGPMRNEELRSAIRDPALRAGYDVEPFLITSLLRDCAEQPSPLPLLEIALERLWRKRNAHGTLTLAEYENMSFEGAIDEHAEGVYDKLPGDPERKLCLSLLLQLAERLDDGRYTRRRVFLESLLPKVDPKDEKSYARVKQVEKVVGLLAGNRARLITIRSERNTARVEIAHEAIFHGWKRLAALLDQNSEFLLWKRRLAFAIADWKDSKTPGGYLDGTPLSRAEIWLKERPEAHSEEERSFISASVQHRLWRRVRQSAAVAALAAAVVAGIVIVRRVESQNDIERAVHSATEILHSNPGMATLLAYDALRLEKSRRTREALQQAVQAAPHPLIETDNITDMSLSSDGASLAVAANGAVLLWTPPLDKTGLRWSPDSLPDSKSLAFPGVAEKVSISPDGKLIAAADDNGSIMIWREGQPEPATPIRLGSKVTALTFARDGHLAIATSAAGAVWWNSDQGKEECRVPLTAAAGTLAVAPDGSVVAAGMDDGYVRFWKPPQNTWTDGLKHDEAIVIYTAYTNDGKHLGSGTQGKAYFWDPVDPARTAKLTAGNEISRAVAMDRQGRRMASWTVGDSLAIFDVSRGQIELNFPGQQFKVFKIDLSSDGAVLAAGAADGIRIYELSDDGLEARARISIKRSGVDLGRCAQYLDRSVCEDLREASK